MRETVLITGANRGIGLALSTAFARHGWQVIACCRNPDHADSLAELKATEAGVTIQQLDVTNDDHIDRLRAELAGTTIDILCNNAGFFGPPQQQFGLLDEAVWLETFRVNTIAPYKIIRALLDNIMLGQRRVVASIGSQMGSLADNSTGDYYVYRTSKAAVHMVMRNVSIDLGKRGVVAVALHPGWVRTAMGGPEAPLSTEQSAAGLFDTLVSLGPGHNGHLLDYLGNTLPW